MARYVSALPTVSFMNAANSILERTLDDSANRRIVIPEAFLAIDECLLLYHKIAGGIMVNKEMIQQNLDKFGVFAGTEALLVELVRKGGDRQKIHEKIRRHAFKAWDEILMGRENPLETLLSEDPEINTVLPPARLKELLDPSNYTGDASDRAEKFVKTNVKLVLSRYADLVKTRRDETRF